VGRDPASSATRQPYSYLDNSPVNGSDPSGLGLVAAAGALLGDAHDVARNVPAALAYIGLATVVNEHDKLLSGDPLKVTSAVLDILAMASPLAVGLAGKIALVGAESVAAEGELSVASSAGGVKLPFTAIRTLGPNEDLSSLANEMKELTCPMVKLSWGLVDQAGLPIFRAT
jgi:hypothetical protein